MRIAVVHYHLRSGGVYRVIEHALRGSAMPEASANGQEPSFAVLVGNAPGANEIHEGHIGVIPQLAYEGEYSPIPAQQLKSALEAEAQRILGGPPDLWHFHNHSLGKNYLVPQVVRLLAAEGWPLLLQIHDFAEDGRPQNYADLLRYVGDGDTAGLSRQLYPFGERVHYGVLTGRDYEVLLGAGASRDRVHIMPNAVEFGEAAQDSAGQTTSFSRGGGLYPTRAIRRKNLGEFLFLANADHTLNQAENEGARWAITMAPENPKERPIYEFWIRTAQELDLPVDFEAGHKHDFHELYQQARMIVTTSVAEGFGMSFLEPWKMGKTVVGRDLPEITRDFKIRGLEFPNLYAKLLIPARLFNTGAFEKRANAALEKSFAAFGSEMPNNAFPRFLAASEGIPGSKTVDFGRLDSQAQAEALAQCVKNPQPYFQSGHYPIFRPNSQSDHAVHNRQVLEQHYSLQAFAQRLFSLYRDVAGCSSAGSIDSLNGPAILHSFLAPERFFPVRAETLD